MEDLEQTFGELRQLIAPQTLDNVRRIDLTPKVGATDTTLAAVAKLRNLAYLTVSSTVVTDQGIALLDELPMLSGLFLHCGGLTDHGLTRLTSMSKLLALSLWGSQLTDEGLKHLEHFPNLRWLAIPKTIVTVKGAIQHPRFKGPSNAGCTMDQGH